MALKYIVITSQVVGGDQTPMTIEHYWDGRKFSKRQDAVSHGFRQRGSDDFNIGYVSDKGNLLSLWWMDEELDEDGVTLHNIGVEVGVR